MTINDTIHFIERGDFEMLYYESSHVAALEIWMIISAVLAVCGAIALHFTFLSKSKDGKFKKFWGWMYDFLTFKKMLIENILKIFYLICALFITLVSFGFIGQNFLMFLAVLVVGNLVTRIIYEFSLILLLICRNTTEINSKLSKDKAKENVTEEIK